MFTIQQASAGSGKTFTLTKLFIQNILAYRKSGDTWKLRSDKDIVNNISSVLAITFTNKATNEMKQRIVKKLTDLAQVAHQDNISEEEINKTDYLAHLIKLTSSSYKDIGQKADVALDAILNNYSGFRVSTIDSFFQEILRTFAYEANLNDAYQLEIDSDFVSKSALDSTLFEMDADPDRMKRVSFWIKEIMKSAASSTHRWNIFTKSETPNSLYHQIKETLKQMQKEEFKTIRQELDTYFSSESVSEKLTQLYLSLKSKSNKEKENAIDYIKKINRQLDDLIVLSNLNLSCFTSNFNNQREKINNLSPEAPDEIKTKHVLKEGGSILLSKFKKNYPEIHDLGISLYKAIDNLNSKKLMPFNAFWDLFGQQIPYVGIILEISRKMMELLQSNNVIQLNDTNFILKKIIGEDDSPFVYERLGNYIEHFLIDEFQDTSQMQWEILRPLLKDNNSKGLDSLLIGDPKQSIYRFRNANYKLILQAPESFSDTVVLGSKREDNTNWRSHQNIVAFNNYFFKSLMVKLSELNRQFGENNDIHTIYGNVVQYPVHTDGKGYVEIRLSKPESETTGDTEPAIRQDPRFEVAEIVNELRGRGYQQKDIAVLVKTNQNAEELIKSLLEYNQLLDDPSRKINFISDESLLVSNSAAVQILIGILERIADENFILKKTTEDKGSIQSSNRIRWNRIRVSYQFYSVQHSDLSPAERITNYLNLESEDDVLGEMLDNLPFATLPAIVEASIERFIDTNLRNEQALFLSAFQDLVNEYSDKYPNDPASFIEWWKAKGKFRSVESPEGVDAIQIMTIHKSKGLEFKCVILPNANNSFEPDSHRPEWRWVHPFNPSDYFDLPPYLPLKTEKALLDTQYENIYRSYYSQVLTDKINMYYVAFTRAKNELYILSSWHQKADASLGHFLTSICDPAAFSTEIFLEEELPNIINARQIKKSESESVVSIGEKFSEDEIKAENQAEESTLKRDVKPIKGYFVNANLPEINFITQDINDTSDL
ncbi:MAG: UvrD-helicase domain-containing protein [Muribaculaceae bacterium]|nr:UvrD-helicase domain-containing protein [Muribaculaceae bacterium]